MLGTPAKARKPQPESRSRPERVDCPYCGKPAELLTGDEVCSQRIDLGEKYFWVCWPCDARVGCHPGTHAPLGTLANAPLRKLRSRLHAAFDPHWLTAPKRHKARIAAYARLAADLGIEKREAHISHFNEARCEKALAVVAEWGAA